MKSFNLSIDTELIERLKKNYFFDSKKVIHLEKGQYLIRNKEQNGRLFLITEGLVAGYLVDDAGQDHEIFRAEKNMFVGVNSFFSDHHKVYADVKALKPCSVLYITTEDLDSIPEDCFADDFVPLIVHELSVRQQFSRNVMIEKEAALKKLYENDKLATLGQMAAGLAHELNNTSGVINGNINWLAQSIKEYVHKHESDEVMRFYDKGLEEGQKQTSEEVRALKDKISKHFSLSGQLAKKIVRLGISEKELKHYRAGANLQEKIEADYHFWQMGVAVHDVLLASNHSTHILQSIKQLSSTGLERFKININDTVHEALTLIKKATVGVEVTTKFSDVSIITANKGELVQVWLNLIKNACESMHSKRQNGKRLVVETHQEADSVCVSILDNGGGIAKPDIERIFRPNFTTKKGGLSFGLGLGLSIVQRIINSYEGTIEVESENSETKFTIILPIQ